MNTPYALLGDCFIYSISVILTIFNTRYTLFNTHFVSESLTVTPVYFSWSS